MTQHSTGPSGEVQLARTPQVAMRLWKDEQPQDKEVHASPYDTVGYVISGRAELVLDGQTTTLAPGDSYAVPSGTPHTYRILETFTAVEATTPPAQ